MEPEVKTKRHHLNYYYDRWEVWSVETPPRVVQKATRIIRAELTSYFGGKYLAVFDVHAGNVAWLID